MRYQEKKVLSLVQKFGPDQRGSTSIEYSLIAVVVSITIIAGVQALAVVLNDLFTEIGNGFPP
jgi:Flp pilus assembly pilin Flp